MQFPFTLSEVCQRGIILHSAEWARTVVHIFLPFHRKMAHSKCFLLTQDSESKLDGIKRDKCEYILLKLEETDSINSFLLLLFPAHYVRSRHTTQRSTV